MRKQINKQDCYEGNKGSKQGRGEGRVTVPASQDPNSQAVRHSQLRLYACPSRSPQRVDFNFNVKQSRVFVFVLRAFLRNHHHHHNKKRFSNVKSEQGHSPVSTNCLSSVIYFFKMGPNRISVLDLVLVTSMSSGNPPRPFVIQMKKLRHRNH